LRQQWLVVADLRCVDAAMVAKRHLGVRWGIWGLPMMREFAPYFVEDGFIILLRSKKSRKIQGTLG